MAKDKSGIRWTTRAIEALTVAKRTDFTDPDTKGLALRVTPTGAKSWALLYRRKGDAKKRRVTLGEFPALGLADARAMAEAKKVLIRTGSDPAGLVSEYKKADTVGQLLDLFLEKHQRPDAVWTLECKRIFNKDVRPLIGSIKLPDLNRGHICLDTPAAQSLPLWALLPLDRLSDDFLEKRINELERSIAAMQVSQSQPCNTRSI